MGKNKKNPGGNKDIPVKGGGILGGMRPRIIPRAGPRIPNPRLGSGRAPVGGRINGAGPTAGGGNRTGGGAGGAREEVVRLPRRAGAPRTEGPRIGGAPRTGPLIGGGATRGAPRIGPRIGGPPR